MAQSQSVNANVICRQLPLSLHAGLGKLFAKGRPATNLRMISISAWKTFTISTEINWRLLVEETVGLCKSERRSAWKDERHRSGHHVASKALCSLDTYPKLKDLPKLIRILYFSKRRCGQLC
jgi:hypothetical protein